MTAIPACSDIARDVDESMNLDALACDRRMRGVVIRAAAAVLLAAFGAVLAASAPPTAAGTGTNAGLRGP